ncbi:SETMR methyltransferase, partial [Acromyrmex heyeri]
NKKNEFHAVIKHLYMKGLTPKEIKAELDRKNRSHLAKKKVLFHQDNARVHTCSAPMAKFNEFRYELLPHPAYSPDLAPCNYFLFPNLKEIKVTWCEIWRMMKNDEVKDFVKLFFKKQGTDFYKLGLSKLQNRYKKCIQVQGDYVEK